MSDTATSESGREQSSPGTPREARGTVTITVTDFVVCSPYFEDSELREAADDIASDIGSALASLGASSIHGTVTVELDGRKAQS